MNNLKYFREETGVKAKDIAKLLNVTVHTYKAFESERCSIPFEIVAMLSIMYKIKEAEFFVNTSCLSKESIERLIEISNMQDENKVELFTVNLLGENATPNYKNIKKAKIRLSQNDR